MKNGKSIVNSKQIFHVFLRLLVFVLRDLKKKQNLIISLSHPRACLNALEYVGTFACPFLLDPLLPFDTQTMEGMETCAPVQAMLITQMICAPLSRSGPVMPG
jgi:hypothetical protein